MGNTFSHKVPFAVIPSRWLIFQLNATTARNHQWRLRRRKNTQSRRRERALQTACAYPEFTICSVYLAEVMRCVELLLQMLHTYEHTHTERYLSLCDASRTFSHGIWVGRKLWSDLMFKHQVHEALCLHNWSMKIDTHFRHRRRVSVAKRSNEKVKIKISTFLHPFGTQSDHLHLYLGWNTHWRSFMQSRGFML